MKRVANKRSLCRHVQPRLNQDYFGSVNTVKPLTLLVNGKTKFLLSSDI